jgi:hypothetical protein
MNRFLDESSINEEEYWNFVFVDRMDHHYTEQSEIPIEEDSNSDSPFINKSPEEISKMLVKLCEDTKPELMYMYIIVMDERTLRDDTVLLVVKVPDSPLEMVRAAFEPSAQSIILYHTGHRGIEEDREMAAENKDNVYRGF